MDEQNTEPQTDPNEPQNEPQTPSPNSEAAKYRRERNAAREERDAFRSRLDARDRQDVDQLAADKLADPEDLWMVSSLDKMRAEDGTIDMTMAEAELQRVVTEHPHWAKPEPVRLPDFHQGVRQTIDRQRPPSFGEAAKKALGGE